MEAYEPAQRATEIKILFKPRIRSAPLFTNIINLPIIFLQRVLITKTSIVFTNYCRQYHFSAQYQELYPMKNMKHFRPQKTPRLTQTISIWLDDPQQAMQ
jgi:hypothetical protein